MNYFMKRCLFIFLLIGVMLCFAPTRGIQEVTAENEAPPEIAEEEPTEEFAPTIQVPEPRPEDSLPAYPTLSSEGIYGGYTHTALGNMVYYNQHDSRWAEYLWSGLDRLTKYGCGPTTLAMIIDSFTDYNVTPTDLAKWASENGYHATGSGSFHDIIPAALSVYGLKVESQQVLTVDTILSTLEFDKILVLLMGPGHFTDGGHFIIITEATEDGLVSIADPQSIENTVQTWDPQLILSELKDSEHGGPVWAVSKIS